MGNVTNTKTKKVLVIEDEPGIREICELALSDKGFQVDTAENGSIALKMLIETEYDLLLVDVRTPLMNGIEFYQHLKSDFPQLVNRVIFTTGDVMNFDVMAFLAKTNRPFLSKPFTIDELNTIFGKAQGLEPEYS